MIEAKPPRPPNRLPPNSMPSRPAPRKPAAKPPSMPMPGRLKNPPPVWGAVVGAVGCACVRCIGCVAVGAVLVDGGAEKVREPREPELEPPPTRASATDEIATAAGNASAVSTAKVLKDARMRFADIIVNPFRPRHGDAAHKLVITGGK